MLVSVVHNRPDWTACVRMSKAPVYETNTFPQENEKIYKQE